MCNFYEIMFQSFWTFSGMLILISTIGVLFIRLVLIILRHWTLRKNGYPPPHCDADGDFKDEAETDEA